MTAQGRLRAHGAPDPSDDRASMPLTAHGRLRANGALEPPQRGGPAALAIDGGHAQCSGPVDVARDGDRLCLAWGTPRFDAGDVPGGTPAARRWLDAHRRQGVRAACGVLGRFAVVVLDGRQRTAWAAVDRFGTHPLCYAADAHEFGFAARADEVPGRSGRLLMQSVFDYLFFHVIPAPATIFADVRRVPAGHYVSWQAGTTECAPHWEPAFREPRSEDFEARKREFLALVQDSVQREATTPQVGAFLSGGTDSSTVSGMLARVLGAPARTYSIGFDAEGYDEMAYARIAAKRFGTVHHEYYVTPADLVEGIPKVATRYDQPFGNSSAVPAWVCATRAREDGVAKLLAGDGGDELFGGNSRYAKQRVFGLYEKVPAALRAGLIEPALRLPGVGRLRLGSKAMSYVEQARVPMPDRLQMYNMLLRLGMANVFEPAFLEQVDPAAPLQGQRAVWNAVRADAPINRQLAFDWKYTLADNDLPKVVGTTELAGIDVGFPLLGDELVDFSLGLPPQWKLNRFQLRWFFKEALRGFLPDEIITKQKHGFGLPFGAWACRDDRLRALAAGALRSMATRGVVRASFVDALLDEHLPAYPHYYGEMVWILMMFEFWLQAHAPDWRVDA